MSFAIFFAAVQAFLKLFTIDKIHVRISCIIKYLYKLFMYTIFPFHLFLTSLLLGQIRFASVVAFTAQKLKL